METAEKRIVGALFLLLGLSFFIVGVHSGQLDAMASFVKNVFGPAVAGMP